MKDYVYNDEKFQSNHTMYYKEPTPAWVITQETWKSRIFLMLTIISTIEFSLLRIPYYIHNCGEE